MKKLTKMLVCNLCAVSTFFLGACEIMWDGLPYRPQGDFGVELFDGNYKEVEKEEVEEKLAELLAQSAEGNLFEIVEEKYTAYLDNYKGASCVAEEGDSTYKGTIETKIVQKKKNEQAYYEALGSVNYKYGGEEREDYSYFVYNDGSYTYYSSEKEKVQQTFTDPFDVSAAFDEESDALASIPLEACIGVDIMWYALTAATEDENFTGTMKFSMVETSEYVKVQVAVKGVAKEEYEGEVEEEAVDMCIVTVYDQDLNMVGNYVKKVDEDNVDGTYTMTMYMLPYSEEITAPEDLSGYTVQQNGNSGNGSSSASGESSSLSTGGSSSLE